MDDSLAMNVQLKQQPMCLIGAVITQATSTFVLSQINPDFIVATEFLVVRNEQRTGAIDSWQDMDLLKVIVPADKADEVFESIYFLAKLDETEGAYMFQHPLIRCTDYQLPTLPSEGVPTDVLDDPALAQQLGLDENDLANLKRLVENQA